MFKYSQIKLQQSQNQLRQTQDKSSKGEFILWGSTTKLAKIEGVTSQTMRRKIESGHYEKVKQTSGGHFRIFISQ